MFKILLATQADIPAIINIARQTWGPTYATILSAEQIQYMLDRIYSPEVLERQINNNEQTYLMISDEDGPQGFVAYGVQPDNKLRYKIHKLYVLPRNQKKGYGQALLQEVVDRLREKHIQAVDLNVNRFNPARTFYEKVGFSVIGEEDIPIGPYWMNDYVMRREL